MKKLDEKEKLLTITGLMRWIEIWNFNNPRWHIAFSMTLKPIGVSSKCKQSKKRVTSRL